MTDFAVRVCCGDVIVCYEELTYEESLRLFDDIARLVGKKVDKVERYSGDSVDEYIRECKE